MELKATLLRKIIPFIAIVHNLYAYGRGTEEKNTYNIFHLIKASAEPSQAFNISIFGDDF